jgi:outer membrane immunogenic protein
MEMSRHGAGVIALAMAASLCGPAVFSARAADLALAPIVEGGGYFSWAGLYAGGNLGGGAGRTSFVVSAPGLFTSTSDEIRGFVGGGQAGYNWQFGPWVTGIEGDIQFSHQQNGVQVSMLQISNGTDMLSTLRGRLGYAGIEDWLFYVTAGGGFMHGTANLNLGGVGGLQETDFAPVWAAGVGVEARVSGRWTGRLEYIYIDGGTVNNTFGIPGGTATVSKTTRDNLFRTGLNYYF